MIEIKIKPLSVNQAWKGRRYKTDLYKKYEKKLLLLLPNMKLIKQKIQLSIEFGFSRVNSSDIDNPVKPFIDILQKKYEFNDSSIYSLRVAKRKVKKGCEYIKWEISPFIEK